MKKTLIAAALVGVCSGVSAHSNVCDYSTDYNINIDEEKIVFSQTDGDKFEFAGDSLLINNKALELDDDQLEASLALQKNARAMVPKIAEVAVEGAELGLKATTIVMVSLFGDDAQMQEDLIAPIEKLTDKIKANITTTSFNSETLDKSFDEAFDEEFETLMETAVTKYSGKIVSNVLSSVFSGDGEELEDLEFRMETMERDIEKYVEANAKELEVKAEALCDDMVKLEALDKQLESVDGYPEDGLIQQGKDHSNLKFSRISFGD